MADNANAPSGMVLDGVVRTPTWPVIGSTLCVVASGTLAGVEWSGLREDTGVSLAGYLLGTLLASLFVVVHRSRVRAAQRDQRYVARPGLDGWAARLLAAGLALGLVHAYVLATEIAKRTSS